jgi:tetratricopeptide (TPR) repeat protein
MVPSADKRAVILGDLILVGSMDPQQLDPQRLKALWQDPRLLAEYRSLGLDSPLSFALNRMAETQALQAWAGPGPLNRDDHPILEYSAPRSIYMSRDAIDVQNRSSFSHLEEASTLVAPLEAYRGSVAAPSPAQQVRESAELCMMKDRMVQAGLLLQVAQSRWPADSHFDLARAQLALYHGDNIQGEALLRSFLRLEPNDHAANARLGKLYLSERRFEESVAFFDAMARRFPKDGEPLVGQGIALVKLERYADAAKALKRAVALNPDDPIASGLLKKLQMEMGL